MGASSVYTFLGRATSDVTSFVRGMKDIQKNLSNVAIKSAEAARAVGTAGTRITAAATATATAVTARFASFEETMVRVGGVTNTLGTQNFPKLAAAAKQAGETTRFTALQSAEAMEQLGLAGLRTEEIISALPNTLQLASAAQTSISKAAEISAKTMRAFNLQAEDMARVNDVLIAGFTNSNFTLESLFEAMSKVGSTATSMGEDIEDVVAILGTMADRGVDASTAGTALRNAFIKLAAPSREGAAIMERFNLQAGEPMIETLAKLEQGFRNVADPAEQLAIVTELFGIRGGPQLLTVLNAGVESTEALSTRIRELGGVASRLEQAGLATLKGQFDLLISAVDALALEIGEALAPEMEQAINLLKQFIQENKSEIIENMRTALVNLVKAGQAFSQWLIENHESVITFVSSLGGILSWIAKFMAEHPSIMAALGALKVAGFLGITSAVTSLISLLGALIPVIVSVGAAALPVLGPAGVIIAGVLALVAAVKAVKALINSLFEDLDEQARGEKLDKQLAEVVARNQARADQERAAAGAAPAASGTSRPASRAPTLDVEELAAAGLAGPSEQAGPSEAEQALADRYRAAADERASGFGEIRDFIDLEGVTADLFEEFVSTLDGVTPDMAAALTDSIAEATNAGLPQEEIDALIEKFASIRNAEQEMADMLDDVQPRMDEVASSLEHLALKGDLTDASMMTIANEYQALYDKLADGKISIDQFNRGMDDLRGMTERSVIAQKEETKAAEEALAAKQKQALIEGDFENAGLDPEKALEDKLASLRMQEFNQGIDKLANEMLGLGDSVDENTKGLKESERKQSKTESDQSSGSGKDVSGQLNTLFAFLNSTEGQAQTLINQIAQLQQAYSFLSTSYNPASYSTLKRFLDEIGLLQQQLDDLSNQTPVLSDYRFGDVLPEQLVASGGTYRGSQVNVSINPRQMHRDEIPRQVQLATSYAKQQGVRKI